MNLFNINYDKLSNLKQINFKVLILIVIFSLFVLIFISFKIDIYNIGEFYGIYKNNKLNVQIDRKLSENIHNVDYIIFKKEKILIKNIDFINYEVIDNNIVENIELKLDKGLFDNEVGIVKFYYGKQKLINYILELFGIGGISENK